MSEVRYKVNGYWHTINVTGVIEAVAFKNDEEIDANIFPESERNEPEL